MKICLITGEFPPMQGGVGDFTREIGLAMNRLGAEVSVVSSVKAAPATGSAGSPAEGFVLERDGLRLTLYPMIERWDFSSWSPITRFLKRTRPDVLGIQYQTGAYQMHPATNFLPWRLRLMQERPKVVVTFHDLRVPYLFPKAGPARRWVTRALILSGEATIVTNEEDRIEAERYGARNLYLLPIGSNIDPQAPPDYDRWKWRERWGVARDEVLLCYFGFLNESKGGETLVRAMGRLVAEGERVKLLMIGGKVGSSDPTNEAYVKQMEALIRDLNLEDRVVSTGYVEGPEVSASFWASDICVLPYRDGVSFRRGTLMAALAHGMPIVSTCPRVAISQIVEGENMALAPSGQPELLADRIREVMASVELRQRLARGASELSRLFSWEAIAEETLALYQRTLRAGK
jgi:glycosyltransferase involved in cell wall biosynthesis